uniref:Glycoprotein beta-5 n=1 Tax=Deroceras reticulatum TaxID=145610 RepID=A0A1X9ZNE3_DERRE|nr:glycoprotein beta-5 [Deroceras reticulatum]
MSLASRLLNLPLSCPSSTVIAVVVMVVSLLASPATLIDPSTTLSCHVRRYQLHITKPPVYDRDGVVYRCSGWVTVNSCWGRCDSSEIGDYQMPYKISHHPVCTYTGRVSRVVTLPNCPGYPDPTEIVFDATGCDCRRCNSDYTSCENLSG